MLEQQRPGAPPIACSINKYLFQTGRPPSFATCRSHAETGVGVDQAATVRAHSQCAEKAKKMRFQ